MLMDQTYEARRLQEEWEIAGIFRHVNVTPNERDILTGYKERDNHAQEFALNALPGMVLAARGASFAVLSKAALVSAKNATEAGSASLLVAAGLIFLAGAVRELKKQNSFFREIKDDDQLEKHYARFLSGDNDAAYRALSIPNIETCRYGSICFISREDDPLYNDEGLSGQAPKNIV